MACAGERTVTTWSNLYPTFFPAFLDRPVPRISSRNFSSVASPKSRFPYLLPLVHLDPPAARADPPSINQGLASAPLIQRPYIAVRTLRFFL